MLFRTKTKINLNGVKAKVKNHLKENWGSPFIAGFILLLLAASTSSFLGFPSDSNVIGTYAVYALIVGVILQLICLIKYQKHGGKA